MSVTPVRAGSSSVFELEDEDDEPSVSQISPLLTPSLSVSGSSPATANLPAFKNGLNRATRTPAFGGVLEAKTDAVAAAGDGGNGGGMHQRSGSGGSAEPERGVDGVQEIDAGLASLHVARDAAAQLVSLAERMRAAGQRRGSGQQQQDDRDPSRSRSAVRDADSSSSQSPQRTNAAMHSSASEPLLPTSHLQKSLSDDAPAPISVLVLTLSGRVVSLQVSPADTIVVLLQSLAETTETCHTTCYTLHMEVQEDVQVDENLECLRDVNGVRLLDVTSCGVLADIQPPVADGQRFRMVAARYDEVDARYHVRVLRSILAGPLGPGQLDGPSACLFPLLDPLSGGALRAGHFAGTLPHQAFSRATAAKTAASILSAAKQVAHAASHDESPSIKVRSDGIPLLPHLDMSLESFFPTAPTVVECLTRLEYSGFNPPPGYRTMLGDLFYLDIETLEGLRLCVTAHMDGFFVNKSTLGNDNVRPRGDKASNSGAALFSPAPSMKQIHAGGVRHHSLAGLLSTISSAFRENFALLLSTRTDRDPFEVYPAPEPAVRSWLADVASQRDHTYDTIRAQDFMVGRLSHTSSAFSLSGPGSVGAYGTNGDGMPVRNDWNEEYQSAVELPAGTVQERIVRDHAVVGVNNDFVAAATKGAELIVSRVVPALNPHEPLPVQMFIYNNIFFSCAIDTANRHEEVDGRYTYRTANNDLHGVEAYSTLQQRKLREAYERLASQRSTNADQDEPHVVDVPSHLCTLATAIIDFRGWRVVAQSMIPGIFNPSTQLYGPAELSSDPEFAQLIQEAADSLCMAPHDIYAPSGPAFDFRLVKSTKPASSTPAEESVHRVFCSAPTKGIVGNDGRRYVIDLVRVTPTDAAVVLRESRLEEAQLPGGQSMAILRLELLDILSDSRGPEQPKFALNCDVFTNVRLAGTAAQNTADEDAVFDASSFMTDVLIPNMVIDFCHLMSVPVDGVTLAAIMHHRGINLRYLGRVANEAAKVGNKHILTLCRREMVARAAKHVLRSILRRTATGMAVGAPIAHFFNCLFGSVPESVAAAADEYAAAAKRRRAASPYHSLGLSSLTVCSSYPVGVDTQRGLVHLASGSSSVSMATQSQQGGKKGSRRSAPAEPVAPSPSSEASATSSSVAVRAAIAFLGTLHDATSSEFGRGLPSVEGVYSSASLWQEISRLVREGFDYDLAGSGSTLASSDRALCSLPVLRSICQKVGIRIRARTYEFSSEKAHFEPFAIEDIAGIHPVVKHMEPRTQDGHDLLEHGVVAVSEGRLDLAFELLSEALVIFSQVYGPMHAATAACFSNLAMVLYQSGDSGEAAVYQLKACVISERVLGLDHHETAQNYGNLSLFSHKHGRTREALAYMSRALYLSTLAAGDDHPDNCTSFANLGLVLQELGAINESLTYLKLALEATDRTAEQLAIARKLRAEQASRMAQQNLQQEIISAAAQDHSLLRAAICHAMATNHSSLGDHREAYKFERMRGDILRDVFGEDAEAVEQSAELQKQYIERACSQQRASRNGRRNGGR